MKSESELSVLVDEPPKRKRKSNSGENVNYHEPPFYPSQPHPAFFFLSFQKPAKPKEKKGKASSTLSKDEETVKRLKVFALPLLKVRLF